MSGLSSACNLDKMQLVWGEAGAVSTDNTVVTRTSCALCTKDSLVINSSATANISCKTPKHNIGQPFYLCTVSCCDSVNCTKPSTTNLISKALATKADLCLYSPYSNESVPQLNGLYPHLNQITNCPLCIKTKQARSRLYFLANLDADLVTPIKQKNLLKNKSHIIEDNSTTAAGPTTIIKNHANTMKTDSISPKLQYLSMENHNNQYNAELSSSPTMLRNGSSCTDYTETYTPVCASVNSNPVNSSVSSHSKFDRKGLPINSEYSIYFSNLKHHGFFRKAVPALPIAVAVLFCMFNLVIPGSGSFLLSNN